MDVLLILLALVGHLFLWAGMFNRMHSTALPLALGRAAELAAAACTVVILGWYAWYFRRHGAAISDADTLRMMGLGGGSYLVFCWIAAAVSLVAWGRRHAFHRPPAALRSHRSRLLNLLRTPEHSNSEDHEHHFLVHLPGNEILHLDVAERTLEVQRLDPALDRLSIVHLSDLHFTGRVGKGYFSEVVDLSNQFEADLVAITGDLVDNPDCIDWIPDTLGRLQSRYGVYFVLGNHDLRVDLRRLRGTLADAGLIDLGGRWVEIKINYERIILAGNELPWIPPAADLEHAPKRSAGGGPLRIALAHSPDQLDWARAYDVDLMLAGHLHGGQIRFPGLGPLLSPSRNGVKYASGVFYDPPTIMHVSRGVSGELPLRMNCPPEMARVELRAVAAD
jgi:hypothetical protein